MTDVARGQVHWVQVLDVIGNDYYLPGTEYVSDTLAQPWPVCSFTTYDSTQLNWSNISVDSLPCTLPTQQSDLFGLGFGRFRFGR